MSSQSSPVTPGTLVVVRKDFTAKLFEGRGFSALGKPHKDFAQKFRGKACMAIVHSLEKDGMVKVVLATPIEQNYCDSCKGELRANQTTGMRSCRNCEKRYGVNPTKITIQVCATDIHEHINPEDRD